MNEAIDEIKRERFHKVTKGFQSLPYAFPTQ
jgi:hypothetical protein